MIGWLYRVLVGRLCSHSWKTIETGPVVNAGRNVGRYFYLRCERCGDVVKRSWS